MVLIAMIVVGMLAADTAQLWASDRGFEPQVVYGDDDRRDLYEVTDSRFLQWADSTVAMIQNDFLQVKGPLTLIEGVLYSESDELCPGQRFGDQSIAAVCSGTLVGDDLVLTAGHCMEGGACADHSFVFGYALAHEGLQAVGAVPSGEVYRCAEVVSEGLIDDRIDYAVVRLDRRVTRHSPMPIRRRGLPKVGQEVIVIGHPSGLPTKVTTGARIRKLEADFFVANLDTFQGNSGSSVINLDTGHIEGILVRGEDDYEWNAASQCNRIKECENDGCQGEDVSYISQAVDFIPSKI